MSRLLILLLFVPTSVLGQTASGVECDPSVSATRDAGHACGDGMPSARQAVRTHRDVVAHIQDALARGDQAAVLASLDDYVLWTGPTGRVFGRAAVAEHLAALGPPALATLEVDAAGRVATTSRHADGQTVRTAWRLVHGLVVAIEQTVEPDDGTGS